LSGEILKSTRQIQCNVREKKLVSHLEKFSDLKSISMTEWALVTNEEEKMTCTTKRCEVPRVGVYQHQDVRHVGQKASARSWW
jgi:hypothetical protein